jgi:hypothetical protein
MASSSNSNSRNDGKAEPTPFAAAVDRVLHLTAELAQLTATTLDALRTIYQDSHIGLASEQRVDPGNEP